VLLPSAGEPDTGYRRYQVVELEYATVVELAGVGDLVLYPLQLLLEQLEVLSGFEVRVGLGDGEELSKDARQGV